MRISGMPGKLAKELDDEIERARLEIKALQLRIREMVIRREKAREGYRCGGGARKEGTKK
jgi:hypothetical protein